MCDFYRSEACLTALKLRHVRPLGVIWYRWNYGLHRHATAIQYVNYTVMVDRTAFAAAVTTAVFEMLSHQCRKLLTIYAKPKTALRPIAWRLQFCRDIHVEIALKREKILRKEYSAMILNIKYLLINYFSILRPRINSWCKFLYSTRKSHAYAWSSFVSKLIDQTSA